MKKYILALSIVLANVCAYAFSVQSAKISAEPIPEYATTNLLVEARVSAVNSSVFQMIIASQSKQSQWHWELYLSPNKGILEAWLPGFEPITVSSRTSITDGKKHDIAFRLTPNRAEFYVDGKKVSSCPITKIPQGTPEAKEPLNIAHLDGMKLNGDIDFIRISSPEEGNEFFLNLPEKYTDELKMYADSSIALWDLNAEINDEKILDLSPKKNHAFLASSVKKNDWVSEWEVAPHMPLFDHKDFSAEKKSTLAFLEKNKLDKSKFAELNSRNEVWAFWNFELADYGKPNYAKVRHIEQLSPITNKGWKEKMLKQTHDSNSVIDTEIDDFPANTIIRQTNALIEYLKKSSSANAKSLDEASKALVSISKVVNQENQKEAYFAACAIKRNVLMRFSPIANTGDLLAVSHGLFEGSVHMLGDRFKHSQDGTGGHFFNQYFGHSTIKGGGLYRIKNYSKGKPVVENILENSVVENGRYKGKKLDFGSFTTPDVSFDGKQILFAWSANDKYNFNVFSQDTCWSIFSVNADGTSLRQITDGAYEDFDPCFLPSGRIAFISTRRGGFIRCFGSYIRVPNFTMFSMNADGSDIVPMSYFETGEWNPVVNNHGMISFTRWDYTDRENCLGSRIWLANPDGTNPRAPHGNYPFPYHSKKGFEKDFQERFPGFPSTFGSRWGTPLVQMSIRQIPNSEKYIFTGTAHHGSYSGTIGIMDINIPDDGHHSQLKRVTPDEPYPETEFSARLFYKYSTPWALNEDIYIANCWENLIALDKFGNKELLCDIRETGKNIDNRFRLLEPMPLSARRMPLEIPVKTYQGANADDDAPKATISVMNVYHTDQALPKDVKIKWLRVIQNILKENHAMGEPMIGYERENTPRIPLGIVPVEDDGSVYFEAPVAKELIFQILDENFMAVQSMRSVAFAFPGEQLSCYGCHENRNEIPNITKMPAAMRRAPSKLQAEMQSIEPISYYRHIHKILMKSNLPMIDKTKSIEDNYQALRDYTSWFSGGMCNNLTGDYVGESGGTRSVPTLFGAMGSKLTEMLKDKQMRGNISDEELRLVNLWMDCNSPRFGAFFEVETQYAGGLVWPTMDIDVANIQGTEFSNAKLKHNFWHENNYGPHPFVAGSHERQSVFIADENGKIVWEYKTENPQDVWMLPSGNILFAWKNGVKEVNRDKETVWEYTVKAPNEVPSVEPLDNGNVLVGIVGECRLVELKNGKEVLSIPLSTTEKTPHAQFRMCRKTPRDTYLVPFTAEGAVREYDSKGNVVREFPKNRMPICAVSLDNGNVLISANNFVTEYDSNNNVVWQLVQEVDAPDINFGVIAGLTKKPNGNIIVCNWNTQETPDGKHGSHIFEITPHKRIVWEVRSSEFNKVANCTLLDENFKPLPNLQK